MATNRKQSALRILALVFSASLMLAYVACNSSPDRPQAATQGPPQGEPADGDASPETEPTPQFDLNEALSKTGTVRPPKPKEDGDEGSGGGGGEGGLFGGDDLD